MVETPRSDRMLDCVGTYCPVPLLRTRREIDKLKSGEVLADDPAAEEDLKRFAKRTGHELITFFKEEDHLRFFIRKKEQGG